MASSHEAGRMRVMRLLTDNDPGRPIMTTDAQRLRTVGSKAELAIHDRSMLIRPERRRGGGSPDVNELRSMLSRAENADGVLRGRTVRRSSGPRPAAGAAAEVRHSPSPPAVPAAPLSVLIMGGTRRDLEPRPLPAFRAQQQRPAPSLTERPLVLPRDREKKLSAKRALAIEQFVGLPPPSGDDNGLNSGCPPSDDWCCAICLKTTWAKAQLSRMPRCGHTFHSACVSKWFQRADDCPICRQVV